MRQTSFGPGLAVSIKSIMCWTQGAAAGPELQKFIVASVCELRCAWKVFNSLISFCVWLELSAGGAFSRSWLAELNTHVFHWPAVGSRSKAPHEPAIKNASDTLNKNRFLISPPVYDRRQTTASKLRKRPVPPESGNPGFFNRGI
jgi:hypothetical protein